MWFCRSCSPARLRCDADDVAEVIAVEQRATAERSDRSIARTPRDSSGRAVAEFGSPHGESWLDRLAGRGWSRSPPAAP